MTVRRSRIYIAAAAAFFAAAAAVLFLTRGLVRVVAAGIMLLAALWLLLFWLLCGICYSEDDQKEFIIRTFFCKRLSVAYCDLWGIHENRLYLPKGSIVLAKGKRTEQFLEYANRRYQSARRKRIPNVIKIKRSYDPMNGNVYEPFSALCLGWLFMSAEMQTISRADSWNSFLSRVRLRFQLNGVRGKRKNEIARNDLILVRGMTFTAGAYVCPS